MGALIVAFMGLPLVRSARRMSLSHHRMTRTATRSFRRLNRRSNVEGHRHLPALQGNGSCRLDGGFIGVTRFPHPREPSAAGRLRGKARSTRRGVWPGLAWAGLIDAQGPTLKLNAVEGLDGGPRLVFVRHDHEAEASGAAGFPVRNETDAFDGAVQAEESPDVVFGRSKCNVADEDFHQLLPIVEFAPGAIVATWRRATCQVANWEERVSLDAGQFKLGVAKRQRTILHASEGNCNLASSSWK